MRTMKIWKILEILNVFFPKRIITTSGKVIASFFTFVFILPFITMEVYLEPEFIPTASNVTYTTGDLAILVCAVQHLGNKYVSWRKTSDPSPLTVGTLVYAPDSRFHVRYIDYRGQWNLYIKNVSRSDAGIYECQVSTQMRDMRKYVLLNVIDPPVTTTKTYTNKADSIISGPVSVDVGNELYVTCNVSTVGYHRDSFEINWFFNGNIIDEDHKHINITKQLSASHIQSTLSIKHVSKEDSGEYICSTTSQQVGRQHIFVLNGEKSSSNTKRRTEDTDKEKVSSQTNHGTIISFHTHNFLVYLTIMLLIYKAFIR